MNRSLDTAPSTIAGHTFVPLDRAGGDILSLRIALRGAPLVVLARALARLDGVRVADGPGEAGRERCYLVHCLGFKMVLSRVPDRPDAGTVADTDEQIYEDTSDFALALVSRTPRTLAVMSDLGGLLEHLMSQPPPVVERAPTSRQSAHDGVREGVEDGVEDGVKDGGASMRTSTALRRSALHQGKPLARKTALTRKTPLARGRFRKS